MESDDPIINIMLEKRENIKKNLKNARKEQRKLRNRLQHLKPAWNMTLYEFGNKRHEVTEAREELDKLEYRIATMNVEFATIDDIINTAWLRIGEWHGNGIRMFKSGTKEEGTITKRED